jgi:hypothetical protein
LGFGYGTVWRFLARHKITRKKKTGHASEQERVHWVLDVVFKEDQSRPRKGHGAKNMAVVRHFAINLVRSAKDKRSIKSRRKIAGWDPNYLAELLTSPPR